MTFSQRQGLEPIRVELQHDSIDEDLRNRLWSAVYICFFEHGYGFFLTQFRYSRTDIEARHIWMNFFKKTWDTFPTLAYPDLFTFEVKEFFFSCPWNKVYDLIAELVNLLPATSHQGVNQNQFVKIVNGSLEKEMSAYRLINGQIVPITSELQIQSIEQALSDSSILKNVNEHLNAALRMLSDRQSPDYRNSIKESISAVEALCKSLSNNPKGTLGKVLDQLENKNIKLHPSMKEAWSKLYGYTSDKAGIRHALLLDSQDVSSAEAKYMLISCSAFVSYLIQLAQEADIKMN